MGGSKTRLRLGPRWLYPAKALATRGRSAAFLARPGRKSGAPGVRILFYHRVTDERDELAVTPRAFAEQMAELAERGYRAVELGEVASVVRGDGAGDGVVGISFDDGYADIAEHAAPVLDAYGFTATVFVATGVTDGRVPLTWYREQPPLISWDEIRELDRSSPLRFEAHTVTHPNLLQLDDEAARREIGDCRVELADRLGREVDGFCYPAGLYGSRERRLVADAGYVWAATCEPGANGAHGDVFALRRIQVDARDSLVDFRAKLLGGHDRPLPLRRLYRRARFGQPTAAD